MIGDILTVILGIGFGTWEIVLARKSRGSSAKYKKVHVCFAIGIYALTAVIAATLFLEKYWRS